MTQKTHTTNNRTHYLAQETSKKSSSQANDVMLWSTCCRTPYPEHIVKKIKAQSALSS